MLKRVWDLQVRFYKKVFNRIRTMIILMRHQNVLKETIQRMINDNQVEVISMDELERRFNR